MKAGGREDMSVVVGLIIRSRIQSLTALESEYNKSPAAGGGQRKRCGPSEPRANTAEIEPQKEGFYSDPSGAR